METELQKKPKVDCEKMGESDKLQSENPKISGHSNDKSIV